MSPGSGEGGGPRSGPGSDPAPGLTPEGRHPRLVPQNWAELIDPAEWELGPDGLPSRRAARVLVLTDGGQVLLLSGHDLADADHTWLFTPGGGLHPGEEPAAGALRELAEETGLRVEPSALEGPIAKRDAIFRFAQVTCRQREIFFLLRLPAATSLDGSGWTALERDAVDTMGWWSREELARERDRGQEIYPVALPDVLQDLQDGWDGVALDLTDPADAEELAALDAVATPVEGPTVTRPASPTSPENPENSKNPERPENPERPGSGAPAAHQGAGTTAGVHGSTLSARNPRALFPAPSVLDGRRTIGVLALQGDVREHSLALEAAGARAVSVRSAAHLGSAPGERLDGLILPGGESTTMSTLLTSFGMLEPLRGLIAAGLPVYGSCAGMIMLADRVEGAAAGQSFLGGIRMTVRRNAFGRQVDSYEEDLVAPALGAGQDRPLRAVFIRAPWVEEVGPQVEILATTRAGRAGAEGSGTGGRIVAVRQGPLLATSFHPEVGGDHRVHDAFVDMVDAVAR